MEDAMLSRRVMLRSASAAAAGLLIDGVRPSAALASPPDRLAPDRLAPLKQGAAARGLSFGSSVTLDALRFDPGYDALVRSQCSQITPEVEFKWGRFQPRQEVFKDFGAKWLLQWAKDRGLEVRGHTLIWHRNMPGWASGALIDAPKATFDRRVSGMADRFRGQIVEWDVVNEAIEPAHGRPDGLRASVFADVLGADYIARAFSLAHEADPTARLYYNDYGFETSSSDHEARRGILIRLLEDLLRRRVPIHGVGIQGHLFSHQTTDARAFGDLIHRIGQMGLAIKVTELDVRDRFPDFMPGRDWRCAMAARRFLDVALAEPAVRGITVWGLSDRYTYLRTKEPLGRPTPYDQDFQPKELRAAIAAAMDARNPPGLARAARSARQVR